MTIEKTTRYFKIGNLLLLFIIGCLLLAMVISASMERITIKESRHEIAGQTVVERCITCHLPENHKPVFGHTPETQSCTLCHDGLGQGTNINVAHLGSIKPYTETLGSLLTGKTISASCLRCHTPEQLPTEAPGYRGWNLFVSQACGQCHQVKGLSAGTKGPDLTHVGDLKSVKEIQERLLNLSSGRTYSRMPILNVSSEEAFNIGLFLKGQSKLHVRPSDYEYVSTEDVDLQEIFRCASCHKMNSSDGMLAPDLDLIAANRDTDWIREFVQDPEAKLPGARMPAWENTPELEQFVQKLTPIQKVTKTLPSSKVEQYQVYCERCHGESGNGQGIISKNLVDSPRRFQDNFGYFALNEPKKMSEAIQEGIPGTSMPPFGGVLTKKEADNLLEFITTEFIGSSIKTINDISPAAKSQQLPSFESKASNLYEQYCTKCHGEYGDRSLQVLHQKMPQPRNLANAIYMSEISDEQLFQAIARGIPGTRMKAYQQSIKGSGVNLKQKFTDTEIWSLVEYVRRLSAQ